MRCIDTPAQPILGTGIGTNGLSTYETSSPGQGTRKQKGLGTGTPKENSGAGVSYSLEQ